MNILYNFWCDVNFVFAEKGYSMSKKNSHLTKKEHEIMKVLWSSDKPLLISEVLSNVKNVAGNSVHPMINSLLGKGYIKVVGNVQVVKTPSRLYAPAVSVDEYAAIQFAEVFKSNGRNFVFTDFLNYLIKHNKSRADEIINELSDFLSLYRNAE